MGKRTPPSETLANAEGRKSKKPRVSLKPEKPKNDIDFISQDDYIISGGLQYVRPYVFEFRCYFKPRWKNKTVFDVFMDEFRHADYDYWCKEFYDGRVLCSGRPIDKDTQWEDGMLVVHIVHRHESPVFAKKLDIVQDTKDFVVVNKPASMPVHACGTYRRNTLVAVLRAFHGYEALHVLHRLDKETSGLVVLGKTPASASQFSKALKERSVFKTYVAEVNGLFPDDLSECTRPVLWDKREIRASVSDEGLEAKTEFKVLRRNQARGTSFLECRPLTGRSHQIRIHLAHLGYPIVNDPLYGKVADKGEAGGHGRSPTSDARQPSLLEGPFAETAVDGYMRESDMACEWSENVRRKVGRSLTTLEEGKKLSCSNCPQVTNSKNVGLEDMVIHLHALRYESGKWNFEVPEAEWMQNGEEQRPSGLRKMCAMC